MASMLHLASPVLLRRPSSVPLAMAKPSLIPNPRSCLGASGRASAVPLRREELGAVVRALAAEASAATTTDAGPEAARRLYVGNIPRTVTNEELAEIVGQHGSVEKAEVMYDKYSGRSRRFGFATMATVEDASTAAEKLNGTEIGGRTVKVNITEKPLQSVDLSVLETEELKFVDSPYKIYVGNLAKTVTTDMLSDLFSERGKVLGARISRVPGTSKSTGYGFITYSSEEEVEAAISTFNNKVVEGQRIRVNKA